VKTTLVFFALLAATPASALEYSWRPSSTPNGILIDATGDFELDEVQRFASWMKSTGLHKNIDGISFNSPGGNIMGALGMVTVIKGTIEYQNAPIMTAVVNNSICASACVLAWAAGSSKVLGKNARVGVHETSMEGTGTVVSAKVLANEGAPASVIAAMTITSPSGIHWLTREELKAWNVTFVQ
jgi:hypothetical protein